MFGKRRECDQNSAGSMLRSFATIKMRQFIQGAKHMSYETEKVAEDIPTHPEEMKATYNLRVGKYISLQGSARITPAGVVTIGVTTLLVALAFTALTANRKSRFSVRKYIH